MSGIVGCEQAPTAPDRSLAANFSNSLTNTDGPLAEVNIPASIAKLAPSLEKFQPQVHILSPQPDEILADDRVTVKLQVSDLPLSKHPELGLGNHLQVILDKQTNRDVYDLSQPLVFKNLAAGTHTLRVLASRPWYESFKNDGAFDLVTFHVLTKTAENNPDLQRPLLTYIRPTGSYGAEPVLLDYYLTIPSRPLADGGEDSLPDWRIRVTVNEQRFILGGIASVNENSSTPLYLEGFKQGKNWVRLELVDDRGNPMPNVYNDTVEIVTYEPATTDPLARLIRGEIDPNLALSLVNPDLIAIKPSPTLTPTPFLPTPLPTPKTFPTPMPSPIVVKPSPNPIVIAPRPIVEPSPSPIVIAPHPIVEPSPSPIVIPPIVKMPTPSLQPVQTPKLTPKIVEPSISPPPTGVTSNPKSEPQTHPPVPIVKPIPVKPIDPTPQLTTLPSPVKPKELPSIVSARQDVPSVNVIVIPQAVVDELISSAQTSNGVSGTVISLPQTVVDELVASARQQRTASVVATPTAPALPILTQPTWQAQAIESFNQARAKIREFTNTIPPKAQRFGQNFQVWVGKTIELFQGRSE